MTTGATTAAATVAEPTTMSAKLLQGLGMKGDNTLFKLLNNPVGEGVAAGLIAQLLASMTDEEEDERTAFERRPFGFGGPGGQIGGLPITYAMGGEMNFPRRDGGIDPSEGSGTKDDVPPMLTAGEFVLTKDAVKGLGDGNQRLGIQRAYDMMGDLERESIMAVQTVEQIQRLPPYMEGLQKRLLQSVFGTFDGEDQKTPWFNR